MQDSSLKELLAGKLQLSVVAAEKASGVVSHWIPGAVVGRPGEGRSERVEEVEEGPAYDHIVVGGHNEGDDNSRQASTYGSRSRKPGLSIKRMWGMPTAGEMDAASHL